MREMRNKLIAAGVAVVMGGVGLVALTGAASPAEPQALKLSPAEASLMQSQVDSWLKNSVGGKQIEVNVISFDDGDTLLILPLPGESVARRATEDVGVLGTPNCAGLNACLYDGTNFDGARLQREPCGEINLRSLNFANITQSIHNNQSNNTQTYIMNDAKQILNANRAVSKVNDVGVGSSNRATYWRVC